MADRGSVLTRLLYGCNTCFEGAPVLTVLRLARCNALLEYLCGVLRMRRREIQITELDSVA